MVKIVPKILHVNSLVYFLLDLLHVAEWGTPITDNVNFDTHRQGRRGHHFGQGYLFKRCFPTPKNGWPGLLAPQGPTRARAMPGYPLP